MTGETLFRADRGPGTFEPFRCRLHDDSLGLGFTTSLSTTGPTIRLSPEDRDRLPAVLLRLLADIWSLEQFETHAAVALRHAREARANAA